MGKDTKIKRGVRGSSSDQRWKPAWARQVLIVTVSHKASHAIRSRRIVQTHGDVQIRGFPSWHSVRVQTLRHTEKLSGSHLLTA